MQTLTIRLIEFICFSFLITLIWSAVAYGQSDQQVTIYRDNYGVPHIYGDSEEVVAYGHGYAQAEDRLETLLKAYRKAEGTMAEAFGEEFIEHDYRQRMLGHAEVSKRRYDELKPRTRKVIEYFLAGVKDYMREHPDSPHYTDQAEKLFQHKK
ncbi:MAG: penicillin acylase family protein, partial [Candidatus Poribacteria bacterium]